MEKNNQTFGMTAQYIKDLSFENINSISQIESSDRQPQIDVKFKVDTEKTKEKDGHRVTLITKIEAKLDRPLFILELHYVGEFIIGGFPEEMVEHILHLECTGLLFPFARSIIANVTGEGGYPLRLAPISFADLYRQQTESQGQIKS